MTKLEHRTQQPLTRRDFLLRLLKTTSLAVAFIGGALGIGMVCYHGFENLTWVDSFLNASMILGGMGPVNEMHTEAGKIFAGCYALFSGIFFIAMAGILLTPFAHRVLHRFHYDSDSPDN